MNCTRCHIDKPLDSLHFYRHARFKTGFRSECKSCTNGDTTKWRQNGNKARENATQLKRRRERARTDPEYTPALRRKRREYARRRYHTDPDFRRMTNARSREYHHHRYHTDPDYRRRHLKASKRWWTLRYHSDPEYRRRVAEKSKYYYQRRKLKAKSLTAKAHH